MTRGVHVFLLMTVVKLPTVLKKRFLFDWFYDTLSVAHVCQCVCLCVHASGQNTSEHDTEIRSEKMSMRNKLLL